MPGPTVLLAARSAKTSLCAILVIAGLNASRMIPAQTASHPRSSSAGDLASLFARIVPDDCHAASDSNLAELKSALADFRIHKNREGQLRALTLLGQLYEQSGEYKAALPYLQSALGLVSDAEGRAQVLVMTADALTQIGQADAAKRDATEALKVSMKLADIADESSALRAQAEAVAV